MKATSGLGLLIMAVCFCLTTVSADIVSVPDLVGNWTGTSSGHYAEIGYIEEGTYTYTLVIPEQRDRVFNGTLIEEGIDGHREYRFSGIIAPDMKELQIVEYGTGIDMGYLISDTDMELILLVHDEKGLAELCSLTKSE